MLVRKVQGITDIASLGPPHPDSPSIDTHCERFFFFIAPPALGSRGLAVRARGGDGGLIKCCRAGALEASKNLPVRRDDF